MAMRAAPSRSRWSSRAFATASRMRFVDADFDTVTPAPAATTRRAPSGWSRPHGMHTSGTPHESPALTVPHPAWVTSSDAWGRTARWGTNGVTTVFAPGVSADVSSAGPAVSSARTGSSATAARTRRARSSWRMYVVLKLTTTSGRSSSAGHGEVHDSSLGSNAGPTKRTPSGSTARLAKSSSGAVKTRTRAAPRIWSTQLSTRARPRAVRSAFVAVVSGRHVRAPMRRTVAWNARPIPVLGHRMPSP
jgi:hypothetical protein